VLFGSLPFHCCLRFHRWEQLHIARQVDGGLSRYFFGKRDGACEQVPLAQIKTLLLTYGVNLDYPERYVDHQHGKKAHCFIDL